MGTILKDVVISNCKVNYANFADAKIKNMKIEDSNLEESTFYETSIKNLELDKVNFTKSEIVQTSLKDIDFSSSIIHNIKADNYSIKGMIIDRFQSDELVRILGVNIKE